MNGSTRRCEIGWLLASTRTLWMLLSKNGQHGVPCGNTCISPGKVCKAGSAVDPKVDAFFPSERYPEFASYKPEMSTSEAADYVASSTVRAEVYHATGPQAEESIRQEGVVAGSGSVAFAKGHYLAANKEYAGEFGSRIVSQHVLIKNPKKFKDIEDFRNWQDLTGISSLPEKYHAHLSTMDLLEGGHDGVHILRDNIGRPDSESWLAFHPKQVVSLRRK